MNLKARYANRVMRENNAETVRYLWEHPRIPRKGKNYRLVFDWTVQALALGVHFDRDVWDRTWCVSAVVGPVYLGLQTENVKS